MRSLPRCTTARSSILPARRSSRAAWSRSTMATIIGLRRWAPMAVDERGAVDAIAVVGMGCVFPGASDLRTYWQNIVGGVDAISTVPPARWDPVFFDPESSAADRFYCNRG